VLSDHQKLVGFDNEWIRWWLLLEIWCYRSLKKTEIEVVDSVIFEKAKHDLINDFLALF